MSLLRKLFACQSVIKKFLDSSKVFSFDLPKHISVVGLADFYRGRCLILYPIAMSNSENSPNTSPLELSNGTTTTGTQCDYLSTEESMFVFKNYYSDPEYEGDGFEYIIPEKKNSKKSRERARQAYVKEQQEKIAKKENDSEEKLLPVKELNSKNLETSTGGEHMKEKDAVEGEEKKEVDRLEDELSENTKEESSTNEKAIKQK